MLRSALLTVLTLTASPLLGGEFFTLSGHGGPIKGIASDTSGRVATASFDNSVGYWRDGQPHWLEAHAAAVNTVAFVDANTLVSAGDDFAVYRWDIATGTAQLLGHHKGKVMSLAVSPSGTTVASASWDGTIGLWSLDGDTPQFLTGHASSVNDVAFTPDGQGLYSASADGSIRVWDVATGQQKAQVLAGGFGINTLALAPDADWLAYGAVDGVTRIIDPDSGALIKDFTLERRPILAMALDPKGQTLAVGDGQGYISVLNTADWSLLADFRATQRGLIWALAFSPDGGNIHAGGLDDTLYSWPLNGPKDAQMTLADADFLQGAEASNRGEHQFNRKCSICHSLTADSQRRAGPTLQNLFGRPAGTVPGYIYSETLQTSPIIWGAETIDALFDLGPDVYIEGTKMPVQRITDPEDRAALIAFLRSHSTPQE